MDSSVTIVRGTNDKPVSSGELARFFSKNAEQTSGDLFIGYPIIATAEGRHRIDALLISPQHGIVVFDLVEGTNPGDYDGRQDDSANKLEARLRTHRDLLDRRNLLVPIHSISFAPGIGDPTQFESAANPLANVNTLATELDKLDWPGRRDDIYRAALSAIQSISTIRKSRMRRVVSRDDSRGAKLKRLEDSIATLDNLQSKAVVETVDDVQRIRGLAGSGKTIVLALKAAYLHAQHPDWRIAVTFNTRSLKGQFRRLINNFTVEQTGEEPDWERLRILNAWGAPGGIERDGIYHEFCKVHEIDYLDFGSARDRFGLDRAFAGACETALGQVRASKAFYDAVLVDEAQDFPPSFLRLCYETMSEPKRLVYAYDELQDLAGASLPPREEIFGRRPDGTPRVTARSSEHDEARYDIILEKCYRNSRPVLVSAHSLGFGIYRSPPALGELGLVQMFEDSQLWYDIGYHRKSGELRDGAPVVLHRTEETSPKFLEEHSSIDDLIQFIFFKDADAQADWLAAQIATNLHNDELRHDDIVVINPDPRTTRAKVGPIRRRLLDLGINSHLAGVDTNPDVFFQSDVQSITFTGIYRAKGNEAGMVYVVNAQDCEAAWNLATVRNQLFTAITRSKAWVRVLGVGDRMKNLIREYEELRRRDFELRFTYPTEEQRKKLKIVHRDMSPEQRKRVKERQQSLADLLSDLESGALLVEDLDDELRAKLQAMLSGNTRR